MFEFHKDRRRYFEMQILNTNKYVLPFIEERFEVKPGMRVLEIGCGEAGNLKPFLDIGCRCVGVDMNETRIKFSRENFSDHPNNHLLKLIVADRESETNDNFSADFAVAIGAHYVKFGAPNRERASHYNRLLSIEKEIEDYTKNGSLGK